MDIAKEIFSALREKSIKLILNGDDIEVVSYEQKLTSDVVNEIRTNKEKLITYLKFLENSKVSQIPTIPIDKLSQNYPLSSAQMRLWVLSQFEEASIAHNIPSQIELPKECDIDCFTRAIDSAIERHEILRTVFKENERGEISQWILKKEDLGFEIDYKDFRKEQNKEVLVQSYFYQDSHKSFDLEKGPLLRAALLQVEDQKYVFYYNMHHIISDGWSMEVLSKDVFAYYDAYKENRDPELKDLRIQYKDYSAWQLRQLEEDSYKAHRSYWLDSLSGEIPLLDLPHTKQRPRLKSHNGQTLSTYISKAASGKLKKYTQENSGSLFMSLLAIWNVLMYRYTSQKDLIIGTPIAGREHSDLEDQIGFYVNTLALRNEIKPEESFNDFYQRVKENTVKSFNHQMYPFDKLVEELSLQRDTSRNAVFDVMLTLQNVGEKTEELKLSKDEENHVVYHGTSKSKFDLDVSFGDEGNRLYMYLNYNSDVYDRDMVEGLIRHYKQLLSALLENPDEKISQIDCLSAQEKHELLVTFNDNEVAYQKEKTIVDLFEEQVEKTPDNTAVVFEGTELTYRELNERSNQLAHYLQKNYTIKPEDLVGIKQERSEWMIVSILGVLKSGGAYVAIDPKYPQYRIDFIEKDTRSKVFIDEVELSKFKENQSSYPKEKVISKVKSDNLAYVIYTSGSTGIPKGVMIEHKNAHSFIKWSHDEFANSEFDRVLFTTSLNFDLSVFEIFHPLTKGKSLRVLKDGLSIPKNLEKGKRLMINTVPSVIGALLQEGMSFESVSVLNMAGEPIPSNYKAELKGKVKEIRNLYGPSEDTTYTTIFRIDEDQRDLIGKPISNTQIYILNEKEELQPIGVIGEICISGSGLARGYLNQEDLTKEKFVDNPFKKGERLYKTGDLGRWQSDGNIEFLGREDDQVKIRGYRIELGEIEHALVTNKEIEQAVVLARENENNEKEIVAYITAKEEQNTSDLRSYLTNFLPEYMVPSYFVQLKEMPLTSNGKVDKKALPNPEGLGLTSGIEFVAPRNATEKKLVTIWEEILKKENIGVKDNFFDLGGHSLGAALFLSKVKRELEIDFDIVDFYNFPTIENVVHKIGSKTNSGIIELNKSNAENTTIYFLPPILGMGFCYKPLAEMISDNFKCFAFQSSGLYPNEKLAKSLFDEANLFAQFILEKENDSEIILCGYSFGAYLAFEISKILDKYGFKKYSLIIMDLATDISEILDVNAELRNFDEVAVNNIDLFNSKEQIKRYRNVLENNLNILIDYNNVNGKVLNKIIAIEASKNEIDRNLQDWERFTVSNVKIERLNCIHGHMLNSEFLPELKKIIENYKLD